MPIEKASGESSTLAVGKLKSSSSKSKNQGTLSCGVGRSTQSRSHQTLARRARSGFDAVPGLNSCRSFATLGRAPSRRICSTAVLGPLSLYHGRAQLLIVVPAEGVIVDIPGHLRHFHPIPPGFTQQDPVIRQQVEYDARGGVVDFLVFESSFIEDPVRH